MQLKLHHQTFYEKQNPYLPAVCVIFLSPSMAVMRKDFFNFLNLLGTNVYSQEAMFYIYFSHVHLRPWLNLRLWGK